MKMVRLSAILLLFINGMSATFGGLSLVLGPDGRSMQMPLSLLEHSPFHTFLIPGLILFLILGLGSLITAFQAVFNTSFYPISVILVGIALVIWITVQIFMIQQLNFLQLVYGGIGVLLLWMGLNLLKAMRISVRYPYDIY